VLVGVCDIYTCIHILVSGTRRQVCEEVTNTVCTLERTVAGALVLMSDTRICIHILVSGTFTYTWREQSRELW